MSAPQPISPRTLRIAPASGQTGRLMVLLHGVGDSAQNFLPIAQALAPALPDTELLVVDGIQPFDGGGTGRQWFSIRGVTEQNRAGRVAEVGRQLSAWLDAQLAERGLGGERLILVGFSQGAILSQWLALHRDPAPTVVALSGRLAVEDHLAAKVPARVLLVHGEEDPMMPVALVREAAAGLEARGAQVETRVIPGLGHGIDARVLEEVKRFLQLSP